MTLTFTVNDVEYTAPEFDNTTRKIEDYILDVVAWDFALRPEGDELTTIRCNISGFPIAKIHAKELDDMIIAACANLKLSRFNDWIAQFTQRDVAEAIESVIDHMSIRVLQLARPAPSISYSKGSPILSSLSKLRQTAVLLNSLIWDAGMFRNAWAGESDLVTRLRAQAFIADSLQESWTDSEETASELHAALVELDAKYLITKLRFTRKEMERINVIRESNDITTIVNLTTQLVTDMIVYRDTTQDIEVQPQRWTQKVYADNTFNAIQKPENSNILQTAKPEKTGPASNRQKKPQTEAEIVKAKQKSLFKSLLANAFAPSGKE